MNVKRLILVLGLAGFIVMADNWVVSPLLPTVAREFSVDPARAGVLIAAYMLPFGLFQLLYGPLADRFGKLRVVTISLALFTVATALCASATGLADLTAFRACNANRNLAPFVQNVEDAAMKAGLTETPLLTVNGKAIPATTFSGKTGDDLKAIIDAAAKG